MDTIHKTSIQKDTFCDPNHNFPTLSMFICWGEHGISYVYIATLLFTTSYHSSISLFGRSCWVVSTSFRPLLTNPSKSSAPNSPCSTRTRAELLLEIDERNKESERTTRERERPPTTADTLWISSGMTWREDVRIASHIPKRHLLQKQLFAWF